VPTIRWLSLPLVLISLLAAGCAFGPAEAPASAPNRIAYVGLDEHIYVTSLEPGEPLRVSALPGERPSAPGQRLMRWPTWAPDGQRLAFLRYDIERGGDVTSSIYVVSADGSEQVRAFASTEEAPIYLSWAPDGGALTLLSQRERDLHLQSIDASGSGQARSLATGDPLYFAWAPDARRLLLHVNGDGRANGRGLLKMIGHGEAASPPTNLLTRPTDFRAPSWSPDGSQVAYAALTPGGQSTLAVQPLGADEPVRLAALGPEPAILWSPTGDRLAFSSRVARRPILYRGIETIKPDGSDRQTISEADVAAYYWSPDGKRLAFAAINQGTQSMTWFVVDANGKNRRQVGTFVPSEEQVFMFAFFDQYAQSHGVWSPDGKYLVFAGSTAESAPGRGQAPLAGPGEAAGPPAQVFVAAADGNSPPRVVVDGNLALWPVALPRAR
jgi:TolB protein